VIRHIVLFRFKVETASATRDFVLNELRQFPSRFPAMQRFGLGENISKRDQGFSHVMSIEFERPADLEAYLNSAEHELFVETHFRPNIEERAIASYETAPAERMTAA
jgi:2,3-dihydroxy-p-cumate/2,3-dihydroxybenzoate 3,4-dioxygenase